MPDEVFILIALAIVGGVAIVLASLIVWYLRSRSKDVGNGVTASELQRIVENAVRNATEPLHRRLEHLEQGQLSAPDPEANAPQRSRSQQLLE